MPQFVLQNCEKLQNLSEICVKKKSVPHSTVYLRCGVYKKYKRLVYTPPDLSARFCKVILSNTKIPVIYRRNARVLEKQNFIPAYMKGGRTYGRTPCERFSQNQNFLDAYKITKFSYPWCSAKKYKRLPYRSPHLLARFCKINLSNTKNSA